MAQKIIELPDIGPIILAKRRGAKNLKLSILPNGKVRVSLPVWAPYSSAIGFALARKSWIRQNISANAEAPLSSGQRIGKSYRLKFVSSPKASLTTARLGINSITVSSPFDIGHTEVQQKAQKAAERALKKEAEVLLGQRLKLISNKHGLDYRELKVKKLSSRWGSCSSTGVITLNYFLIQLPWRLIDYVIVHELAHTKQLNHGSEFWRLTESVIPDAKVRRREIKAYRPMLLPSR